MHRKARSQELLECIQSCKDCHDLCVDTAAYCLGLGGRHAAAKHMRLLLDCAQVASTTEDYMLRDSAFYEKLCALCADVCDSCAAACAAFSGEAQMQACAGACLGCADACRRMMAFGAWQASQVAQVSCNL